MSVHSSHFTRRGLLGGFTALFATCAVGGPAAAKRRAHRHGARHHGVTLPKHPPVPTPRPDDAGAGAATPDNPQDTSPDGNKTAPGPVRRLKLHNTHTDESIDIVYKRGDTYDDAALAKIAHVLRDHRRKGKGAETVFARELFDLLADIADEIERRHPGKDVVFEVVSGYRSAETNRRLRAHGGGQAKGSRHVHGEAIDIRVEGIARAELRDIAWCANRGGVGDYPGRGGNFVHVDVYKDRTKDKRFPGGDRYRAWGWDPKPGRCPAP